MSLDAASPSPRSTPEFDPNVDCFDCAPEYEPLRQAIAANDWSGFAATLRAWPAADVSRALFHLGEHDDESYQAFPVEHDDEPFAKIALAYRHVTLGWRARTTASASQVSADQFVEFRRHLAQAELHLVEACAIDPTIPSAWTARVLTARALSLSASETRRRYGRLTALGGDFWGQVQMHQYLEPKWFGSVEAAREHVDESQAGSEEWSLSPILVPLFHIERWYQQENDRAALAYLSSSEVQRELDTAAERSVLHPSLGEVTPSVVFGHQVFLTCYWLAGEKRKAARHRSLLGSRTADEYWNLLASNRAGVDAVWQELREISEEKA